MKSIRRFFIRNRKSIVVIISALIMVILLPLWINLASTWLAATLGKTEGDLLNLLVISLLFLILMGIIWYFSRPRIAHPWRLVTPSEQAPRKKGLIVLVGPGTAGRDPFSGSQGPAIEHHLGEPGKPAILKFCWMVTSDQGIPVANALDEKYGDRCRLKIIQIHDAFGVKETYNAVKHVLEVLVQEEGLSPKTDIMADFTGGNKPMTAGMVLACKGLCMMQYTSGREGTESVPKKIDLE